MKKVLLAVMVAAGVGYAQEAATDETVAERTIVIPAHVKRPEVRYAPARDIREGDSIQVIVRFKAAGAQNWSTPFNRQYSPRAGSIPNDKVLLFVLKAAVEESPKVTEP